MLLLLFSRPRALFANRNQNISSNFNLVSFIYAHNYQQTKQQDYVIAFKSVLSRVYVNKTWHTTMHDGDAVTSPFYEAGMFSWHTLYSSDIVSSF